MLKYFIQNAERLKPIDYKTFLSSQELFSLYRSVKDFRVIYHGIQRNCYKESKRVLQLINEELGELKR